MRGPWTPNAHGEELARRLRQLREETGLTQTQAGVRLGRSRYRVQRIEAGYLPWSDELSAMLALYQVPADEQLVFFEMWDKAWQPRRARALRVVEGARP
ncbi:helix-turn-helix domain-containing protein [Kibdelosporangium phytohabitans]|uniref:HTH cro/C1-type domain-containing protein n=1 Tax=Kibdelosporangium phytohabitans TaxID=860235 RepID=A0A0N9HRY9_9PSEU|nr:helix-turn-helix transcriptional regulator [Kibdelosporangium phytohabitans]ALG05846.1 hypothetical protein AOZ06_01955 [Kibdelosporangium phytohabitans]